MVARKLGRQPAMDASGGYEWSRAEALRAAGLKVRVVDLKRVRHFAKAGRMANSDPIDAETIVGSPRRFPRAAPHRTIARVGNSPDWSRLEIP
jgi:transposase